jgi:multicomponent Na+:H+ antiporter subunit F
MTTSYLAVAIVLLLSLCGGMYRVLRGPTPADRMLAGQLFGTVAVAVLALVGEASRLPALVDVALAFALLAAVTIVAFVRLAWARQDDHAEPGS